VSLVALRVPGRPEHLGYLFHLRDWDTFYRYIRVHLQFEAQMVRSEQRFEIYRRMSGEQVTISSGVWINQLTSLHLQSGAR